LKTDAVRGDTGALMFVLINVCGAGVSAAEVGSVWAFAIAVGHVVKGVGDKWSEAAGSL